MIPERVLEIKRWEKKLNLVSNYETCYHRADIIGGLKSVKLAKLYPQNYQPGVGVSEDFELLLNFKNENRIN